jgi:hypothetical protein
VTRTPKISGERGRASGRGKRCSTRFHIRAVQSGVKTTQFPASLGQLMLIAPFLKVENLRDQPGRPLRRRVKRRLCLPDSRQERGFFNQCPCWKPRKVGSLAGSLELCIELFAQGVKRRVGDVGKKCRKAAWREPSQFNQ